MAPDTSGLNYLADTERTLARPVRRSVDAKRDIEVVTHDEVPLAYRDMLVQVHDSRALGTGEAGGVADYNVAEEAVPPREVSAVQHHSRRVLGHDGPVLPGLAIHDMVTESRVGLLMARSSSLVVRIAQAQVKCDFLVQEARMEEGLE